MKTLTKLLSPNDVGYTRTHQAGILVPKYGGFLEFFPQLDTREYNPDAMVTFIDPAGRRWDFRFIYYNNSFFHGTRNEYRLTRMTGFFREFDAEPGDGLVLSVIGNKYYARIVSAPGEAAPGEEIADSVPDIIVPHKTIRLVFDQNWNLIESEE